MKSFLFLLSFVLLITLLSGCTNVAKASLNSQFTLAPGQTVRIQSESMDIKFIGVTGDSRCPRGAECIWAGQVSCAVEITKNKIINQVTLTDSAGSGAATGQDFQNYQILFSITPYPEIGKTISKNDYRLTLTVSQLHY
jgi:hypothetical protein